MWDNRINFQHKVLSKLLLLSHQRGICECGTIWGLSLGIIIIDNFHLHFSPSNVQFSEKCSYIVFDSLSIISI